MHSGVPHPAPGCQFGTAVQGSTWQYREIDSCTVQCSTGCWVQCCLVLSAASRPTPGHQIVRAVQGSTGKSRQYQRQYMSAQQESAQYKGEWRNHRQHRAVWGRTGQHKQASKPTCSDACARQCSSSSDVITNTSTSSSFSFHLDTQQQNDTAAAYVLQQSTALFRTLAQMHDMCNP
jgi:hypothetical protein